MTVPLSPAAQAVLDAVRKICPAPADEIAAAALRAAVDQVIDGRCQNESEKRIYDRLHRIATELEAQ
jgi:hypothetical protein